MRTGCHRYRQPYNSLLVYPQADCVKVVTPNKRGAYVVTGGLEVLASSFYRAELFILKRKER